MTNNERTSRPLVTLALAALIGSGCMAMAAEAGADPAKYSECMRANGVADFPDPDTRGQIAYGGISVTPEVWVNAVGACKDQQPPGFLTEANRTPEQQNAALKFGQCMRDNGVPDFPDPATARDPLIDTTKMPGEPSARSIPGFEDAQEACRDLFEAALPAAAQ
jgi:hypothetical protein